MRYLILLTIFIFFFLACFILEYDIKPKVGKVIDLPEEISIATEADELEIYRVTKDTVYIGFKIKTGSHE